MYIGQDSIETVVLLIASHCIVALVTYIATRKS